MRRRFTTLYDVYILFKFYMYLYLNSNERTSRSIKPYSIIVFVCAYVYMYSLCKYEQRVKTRCTNTIAAYSYILLVLPMRVVTTQPTSANIMCIYRRYESHEGLQCVYRVEHLFLESSHPYLQPLYTIYYL